MGCGQSKIHLYPRKSKSKANGKKGGHGDSDAETDEDEGHIEDAEKFQTRERDKNEEAEDNSNKDSGESDDEVSVSLLRAKNLSLLQSQEISTSQQNFFRMLDKKIEEGPDYDSNSETEIALEEARLNALVQHWESASLTASMCSSASRSLQTTPVRQTPAKQLATSRNMLPTGIPPQVLNAEFLPLTSTSITGSQLPSGALKLATSNKSLVLSHMNSGILHQMAALPQMPLGMPAETSAATPNMATANANSSNALAILQAPNTPPTQQYLLAIPAGSSPLLGKSSQISPKRLVDGRMLINSSPLAQQMQPSPPTNLMQNQYIPATPNLQTATTSNYMNGGRGPQSSAMALQLAYYGQASTAQQQNVQQAISQQQHQQQLLEQTPQSQNQLLSSSTLSASTYYGENVQSVQPPSTEYRFPPAISVQRLAPQVQRQLRETQELIKDSCPQLYATGYGSPGPPPIRNQTGITGRTLPTSRRPTLETQFSQELS
uniref:Uncharacterized protein n=1 Tax=Glossina austeni TaxID=7395 RepID=A0A1A9UG91_GLOAU